MNKNMYSSCIVLLKLISYLIYKYLYRESPNVRFVKEILLQISLLISSGSWQSDLKTVDSSNALTTSFIIPLCVGCAIGKSKSPGAS